MALAATCALGGPAVADPMPSRDYPPTYSSKKAPWYDPLHLFTSSDKTFVVPSGESKPIPNEAIESGTSATPAWKWYGYGTPTPGRNPFAPNGTYQTVPSAWHTASGTTPGAIPKGQYGPPGVIPDPLPMPMGPASSIAISPSVGPVLPTPHGNSVDWKSAPATIRLPTSATPVSTDRPPAKLMAPVHGDPPAPEARTPLQRELPASESPDIPVEPAPGIVAPPIGRASFADVPMTARGLAPSSDLSGVIRQACGSDVRVMEVTSIGPKRLLVRLAAKVDAAMAARDRLSHVSDLAGWRVDFDLVTPLRP